MQSKIDQQEDRCILTMMDIMQLKTAGFHTDPPAVALADIAAR